MDNNLYVVYLLGMSDGGKYIGMSSNIEQRVKDHKRGGTKTTRGREIVSVKILEECDGRQEARLREKYWKSGIGRERIAQMVG